MAYTTLEEISSFENKSSNQVGIFAIKNDGEEAVVRFMHDSVDELELCTVHSGYVDGKYRRISCLRTSAKEPLANCPLCNAGEKLERKVFIHLLQYTTAADGTVTYEPKVWIQGIDCAKQLQDFMKKYGNLSDSVFYIVRNGAAGDKNTRYTIMLAGPAMQKEDVYKKDTEAFDNYRVLGGLLMDKSYEDLQYFVQYGSFPADEGGNGSKAGGAESMESVTRVERPARFS